MFDNSRLKATTIIGQRKAFYRKRISESSCARKETVNIDILVNILEQWQKNYGIYQNNKWVSHEKKEVEPLEPVLRNIYQSNTYTKDLKWPHFDDEPRVQEKQQVKDQQSCIFIFVACLTIPSSN